MLATQPSPFVDIRSYVGIWWLIQTKPQMERRLARELSAARVPHLLPSESVQKIEYDSQGRGHRRTVDRLYFPGYVLLCADEKGNDRYFAARSVATVRTISIVNQDRFVKELASMQIALSADPSLRAIQGLARGEMVRVVNGPFLGMAGRVEDVNASRMVVKVGIASMGQCLPIEMPAEYVEAA